MNTARIYAPLVLPDESFDVISTDPSDNIILEAAVAGGADDIVSGDPRLLELDSFHGLNIVNPTAFLDFLQAR